MGAPGSDMSAEPAEILKELQWKFIKFFTVNAEDLPGHMQRFIAEWSVELDEKIISKAREADSLVIEEDETGSTVLTFVDKSRGNSE